MRIEQLKTALKIVEFKSLTAAADALFLAQPSVTMQIRTLEEELGFDLFERHSNKRKGLKLTERGATYLYYARQALWILEEGRLEALEYKKGGESGGNGN